MKNVKNIILSIVAGSSLLLLAACGGGGGGGGGESTPSSGSGGGSGPASATNISGKVADGYLSGARVFLDRNNNRAYDNGEPTTTSGPSGAYSLDVNLGDGDLYPVVVDVIAGETIDEDDGLPVAQDYQLEAPAGKWQFVSPLTTLVKAEMEKNASFTELEAVLKVRGQLGIDDDVSLFEDYLEPVVNSEKAASGNRMAKEYRRAHKAARVVAGLLASLRGEISQNLGGEIAMSERNAVTYLVTDKIMERCKVVKQALDDERNGAPEVDATTLKKTVAAMIKAENLHQGLVMRYKQRSAQKQPVWDMQPPGLRNKTPMENDSTSVDVTVGMVFDEELDETSISDGVVLVTGPNGPLSGQVSYDATQKRLNFVPDQVLLPFTNYQVTLKKQLADASGNPLEEDVNWSFTTVFDQTPPPLPDF